MEYWCVSLSPLTISLSLLALLITNLLHRYSFECVGVCVS